MDSPTVDLCDGETPVERVNVFNMFRNNEDYLSKFYIPTMLKIEARHPNCRFVYHICESGSDDNTKRLLLQFIKSKDPESRLYFDEHRSYVNKQSGKNYARIETLSEIRNRLVARSRPLKGRWSLFIDSNIYFKENVLERLFKECSPTDNGIGMLCPYTQQLMIPEIHKLPNLTKPSLIGHYYDTYSLYNAKRQSYWPYCGFAKCTMCKDVVKYDREPIPKESMSDVASCFSGFALIHNDPLNDARVVWTSVNYDMEKDEGICEHVMFCHMLRTLHDKRVVIAQNVDQLYRTF